MRAINPWINFNGNAEEAFTFYKSVFGGEFSKILRFKDLASAEFPIPKQFGGEVIGYGYEEEALLTATITPPNNLPSDQAISIGADVSWLVCEKVCLPGKAKLTLDFPAQGNRA